MSISFPAILAITSQQQLNIFASGPCENGRFRGWICMPPEKGGRTIAGIKGHFDTSQAAAEDAKKVVADIRAEFKLCNPLFKLNKATTKTQSDAGKSQLDLMLDQVIDDIMRAELDYTERGIRRHSQRVNTSH